MRIEKFIFIVCDFMFETTYTWFLVYEAKNMYIEG